MSTNKFLLQSSLKPTGDQPQAISKLAKGIKRPDKYQTLLGVTGSGKTFVMANVIQKIQKPTLVLSHNKTLAAQLASEFREFFPKNAVHYFVSYYDYYQPEAYIPRSDTYIEKDADINEEIDRLRHATTEALLTRNDVIVVASVSCIYGMGAPENYEELKLTVSIGEKRKRDELLRALVAIQYSRNDTDLKRGAFRVKGDTVEIHPASSDSIYRVGFFGDKIDGIMTIDPLTGEVLDESNEINIFPATLFSVSPDQLSYTTKLIRTELNQRLAELKQQNKLVEAQRLEEHTNFDLEMMETTGYVKGIENYSRHLSRRAPGTPPTVLLDYFPKDYLMFIDESHMTIPQLHGMYLGDQARKDVLIDYGFRLPSARDNRPLKFDEFIERTNKVIFASATPRPFELGKSKQVAELLIRPTGLLDPSIETRPTKHQIDDLLNEIERRVGKGQRVLVTTLTKRLAEELSEYITEAGIKTHYLHADVDTLDRIEILKNLRLGVYDVVVGINLLREGLDLPEVSLVAILDADKEGFLRNETTLIQTMGRAARHAEGHVILYADRTTQSMKQAIAETERRRTIQQEHNSKHNITPKTIKKAIREDEFTKRKKEIEKDVSDIPESELPHLIRELTSRMHLVAENLEFEKATELRDKIALLKKRSRKG